MGEQAGVGKYMMFREVGGKVGMPREGGHCGRRDSDADLGFVGFHTQRCWS